VISSSAHLSFFSIQYTFSAAVSCCSKPHLGENRGSDYMSTCACSWLIIICHCFVVMWPLISVVVVQASCFLGLPLMVMRLQYAPISCLGCAVIFKWLVICAISDLLPMSLLTATWSSPYFVLLLPYRYYCCCLLASTISSHFRLSRVLLYQSKSTYISPVRQCRACPQNSWLPVSQFLCFVLWLAESRQFS